MSEPSGTRTPARAWARAVDATLEASIVGSFTRLGFTVRRRVFGFDDVDSIDMSDQVVLVTGATSGIGRAAADQFHRMGAEVVVVGRDPDRTRQAASEIASASGGRPVRAYVADMSDLESVRRVVEQIRSQEPRLDVLVNNAGALVAERAESAQGHEMSLATMVLGPILLTEGLVDLLAAYPGGRVVNVASGGMYTQGLVLDDLQCRRDYRGAVAYARAKRALVVLTEQWAKRWESRGVTVNAMHPGWAATPGVHESLPTFERVLGPLLRTPAEGADTIVWLAAADEAKHSSGGFWHDRAKRATHRLARTRASPSERDRLWQRLHELAGA